MPEGIASFWKEASALAVLIVVLYSGYKGWWYWRPGVQALLTQLAHERDEWRVIAVTLMRKQGIELPDGFEKPTGLLLPGEDVRDRRS
jgi:hypothetical protein